MLPYIGDKEKLFEIFNVPKESQQFFLENYISSYRREQLINSSMKLIKELVPNFNLKKTSLISLTRLVDTETAELFIRICKFYFISKRYQPTSYVKLIMILSSIEKTISKEREWEEFHSWIFNSVR